MGSILVCVLEMLPNLIFITICKTDFILPDFTDKDIKVLSLLKQNFLMVMCVVNGKAKFKLRIEGLESPYSFTKPPCFKLVSES